MSSEHPVDVHSFILQDLQDRLQVAEAKIQSMENWQSASDEKTKTVFTVLAELKEMMRQYTTEMREAIFQLAAKMEARFIAIDKEIVDTAGKPGKKAEGYIEKGITFGVGGVIAFLLTQVLKP